MSDTENYLVNSFILNAGEFVNIHDFRGQIPDEDHVEGAIELSLDSIIIIDKRHWDLVDQLWAYLIDSTISACRDGRPVETYFPDQPLRLAVAVVSSEQVEVAIGDNRCSVTRSRFIQAVGRGGIEFFCFLSSLSEGHHEVCKDYVEKCRGLLVMSHH